MDHSLAHLHLMLPTDGALLSLLKYDIRIHHCMGCECLCETLGMW